MNRRLLIIILPLTALLAACNILGPGLYLVSDDRTPAVFGLDSHRTTVVFIDDRNSVLPVRSLRARIAKAAEAEILNNKLLEADLISSDSLQSVVSAERFSRPQSIAQIGRTVGADQVIYATVDSFQLSPDGSQHAPTGTLRVKVIDTRTDKRIFPEKAEGGKDPSFPVSIAEKVRASALPTSNAERLKEQQELADSLGERLGQLFFKHSSRDPDSKVGR
jgi:hypothetical protein